jgi:predicted DNA-binding transcriptional regulator AlpA
MPNEDTLQHDPEALMPTKAAADFLSISAFTLRKWRNRGYGPKMIQISPTRVGYRRRDLIDWIASREAA